MIIASLTTWVSNVLVKYRKWIYTLLILPTAGGIFYQLAYRFFPSLPYYSWPKFHLTILPLAELLFLLACFDIFLHFGSRRKAVFGWQLAFLVAAINLTAVALLNDYYRPRAEYPSVQFVLSFVPVILLILIPVTVLCFWMGFKKDIVRVEKYFSFHEEIQEQEQPRSRTAIILLLFFAAGLFLRLYNLAGFPPYVDEYSHIRTAFNLLNGIPVTYERAYLTVSIPVYLSYRTLGVSLWASRFPMVLINMLAIFPLYSLGKRINKIAAYICVALYVSSPWIIATSRTVREYAVLPFFFYLAAVLLLELLDWESVGFLQYFNRHKFRLAVLASFLAYSIYDNLSIFRIIIVLYGIFGLIAILKVLKSQPSVAFTLTILCTGIVLVLIVIVRSGFIRRFIRFGTFSHYQTSVYWEMLVESTVKQWYILPQLGYAILLVVSLIALGAIFVRYKKADAVVLMSFLAFAANLIYLSYFIVNEQIPPRTRYGVLMEHWYLIVVAVFIFVVYSFLRRSFPKRQPILWFLILAAMFLNFPAIQYALSYEGGGSSRITGEKHYIVGPAYGYLTKKVTEQDVLLTDLLHTYDLILNQQFSEIVTIPYYDLVFKGGLSPLTIVEKYPQGWIALSPNSRPKSFGLNFFDFEYAGKQIDYVGNVGEIYLWKWK